MKGSGSELINCPRKPIKKLCLPSRIRGSSSKNKNKNKKPTSLLIVKKNRIVAHRMNKFCMGKRNLKITKMYKSKNQEIFRGNYRSFKTVIP